MIDSHLNGQNSLDKVQKPTDAHKCGVGEIYPD